MNTPTRPAVRPSETRPTRQGSLTDTSPWAPTDPGSLHDLFNEPGSLSGTLGPESRPFDPAADTIAQRLLAADLVVASAVSATRAELAEPTEPAGGARPAGAIGRYELERPLGAGGLGTVWAAYDTVLTRQVAVKTLPLALPAGSHDALAARILDEARAAARLSHPHIVTVHDAGVAADGAYIAMELLRGKDLSQLLRTGWRPSHDQTALIVRRVADALSYAHGKGVIHRDIKPANIFMVGRTRPVVLDFGIAQLLHRAEATGQALGSPYYAAPEQFEGRECDPRTDVYALGVVLYELLTGVRPYQGSSLQEIRAAVQAGSPRPPCEIDPAIPPELAAIAMSAIQTEPDRRPRTAGTMARELRAWLARHPVASADAGPPTTRLPAAPTVPARL
ncbi:MAG: hypothetical protein RL456_3174, partial [Pseudomonadota bacterium]